MLLETKTRKSDPPYRNELYITPTAVNDQPWKSRPGRQQHGGGRGDFHRAGLHGLVRPVSRREKAVHRWYRLPARAGPAATMEGRAWPSRALGARNPRHPLACASSPLGSTIRRPTRRAQRADCTNERRGGSSWWNSFGQIETSDHPFVKDLGCSTHQVEAESSRARRPAYYEDARQALMEYDGRAGLEQWRLHALIDDAPSEAVKFASGSSTVMRLGARARQAAATMRCGIHLQVKLQKETGTVVDRCLACRVSGWRAS